MSGENNLFAQSNYHITVTDSDGEVIATHEETPTLDTPTPKPSIQHDEDLRLTPTEQHNIAYFAQDGLKEAGEVAAYHAVGSAAEIKDLKSAVQAIGSTLAYVGVDKMEREVKKQLENPTTFTGHFDKAAKIIHESKQAGCMMEQKLNFEVATDLDDFIGFQVSTAGVSCDKDTSKSR